MCGIAGWFGGASMQDPRSYAQALAHRGPDDHGVWQTEKAALIHTRLSIIDLSSSGHQPMVNEDGSKGLVFNGEIYNYNSLRGLLSGCSFKGCSDTEVLFNLLIRYQDQALKHLAGMYAFAFWDEVKQVGILARDPFGIKPLYYRHDSTGVLYFSSEVRPLRHDNDQVCADRLRDTLLWGSVPAPGTIWKEIHQLPPGSFLVWERGEVKRSTFAKVQYGLVQSGITLTDDDSEGVPVDLNNRIAIIHHTRAALHDSVKRHLVSDVPVGIFLSGGIDSTAVLALARNILGPEAKIHTFSIGFHDECYNEAPLTERTAVHFKTHHTTWKMKAEEGLQQLLPFLNALDLPTIDGFNTWCVSLFARREGMKVVLSGVGGDEFFAGYPSFQQVPIFHHLYHSPLRKLIYCAIKNKPTGSAYQRLSAYLKSGGSWLHAYHAMRGIFTPEEAARLAKHISGHEPGSPPFADSDEAQLQGSRPRSIVAHFEVTRYLRNQLLRDSDLFSMAHGLELRTPLVDARLSAALAFIPDRERLRQGKRLLMEALPEIPQWILRQPKRGFRFPFQEWMNGQFGNQLRQIEQNSPVPLKTWYRTWALATVLKVLGHLDFK